MVLIIYEYFENCTAKLASTFPHEVISESCDAQVKSVVSLTVDFSVADSVVVCCNFLK
jgi:hypothetical protein